MSSSSYNATRRSPHARADVDAAVGRRATLALTGTIIEAGESSAGPYVKFEVDARWGFGAQVFVLDLEALEVHDA